MTIRAAGTGRLTARAVRADSEGLPRWAEVYARYSDSEGLPRWAEVYARYSDSEGLPRWAEVYARYSRRWNTSLRPLHGQADSDAAGALPREL